jgi:hypothetical protein
MRCCCKNLHVGTCLHDLSRPNLLQCLRYHSFFTNFISDKVLSVPFYTNKSDAGGIEPLLLLIVKKEGEINFP